MPIRWWIFALVVGAMAAFGVMQWPDMPRWRIDTEGSKFDRASEDGSIIIAVDVPDRTSPIGAFPNPWVFRWDALTGRLLSKAEMQCANPATMKLARPSSDGRIVLVGESVVEDAQKPSFRSGEWFVHDGITGERKSGPIPDVVLVWPNYVSPDGRWFIGIRGDPKAGGAAVGEFGLFSTENGQMLRTIESRSGMPLARCLFSPDGASVILNWLPTNGLNRRNGQHPIDVLSPDPHTQPRRYMFPGSEYLLEWDGRFLITTRQSQIGGRGGAWQVSRITYDLSKPELEAGTGELSVVIDSGPTGMRMGADWGAVVIDERNPMTNASRNWLQNLIRGWLRLNPPDLAQLRIQFIDLSTGTLRREITTPRVNTFMAGPGNSFLLIADNKNHTIEAWEADPPMRWPWAVGTGVLAGGTIVTIGRWRWMASRRSKTAAPASALPIAAS